MRDLCAMKVFRGKRRATLRLPGRSGAGWEEPGAGGPPSSGNSTNQSAKARAITTNSNSNPVHEIARHVTHPGRLLGAPPPRVPVSFLDVLRLFRPLVTFGQDEREIG